jgi:hypothetical protein
MDHADPACKALHDKCRKAEPFIFFFGTLFLVGIAIALVVCESQRQVGPESAQRTISVHH